MCFDDGRKFALSFCLEVATNCTKSEFLLTHGLGEIEFEKHSSIMNNADVYGGLWQGHSLACSVPETRCQRRQKPRRGRQSDCGPEPGLFRYPARQSAPVRAAAGASDGAAGGGGCGRRQCGGGQRTMARRNLAALELSC